MVTNNSNGNGRDISDYYVIDDSVDNILNMQFYPASTITDVNSQSPPRKRRCINKEQDPMSHRIIEKRRRDRMNNCLADLSRLIPAEYLKKGRGRVEKTEIIEMAIRHMKHLQGVRQDVRHPVGGTPVHSHTDDSVDSVSHSTAPSSAAEHYRLGFQECLSETMHFLVDVEGFFARDSLCVQLIGHLQQHCDKILAASDRLGFPHTEIPSSNGLGNTVMYNNGTITTACQQNSQSDRGSSSGVSSLGDHERSNRVVIQPPTIVSDDSNHSTNSHSILPAVSSSLSSLSSSSSSSSLSLSRPQNYKFKSSIKQRFSAERIKSHTPPIMVEKQHGVPIFALHDAGAFYVPLTVEAELLRPHLTFTPDNSSNDTVLHPVTISVNFNHSAPPAWSHHSPNHQQT